MKKMIDQKSFRMFFIVFLFSMVPVGLSQAHDTWINMQNYRLNQSDPAVLSVTNAHSFVIPGKELLPSGQVDTVLFLSPDGKEIPSIPEGNEKYKSNLPLKTDGSYMAVVKKKVLFSSKTVDGYQRGKNKRDLKDVIECSHSEKYAKALFTVGVAAGDVYSKVLGHPMEIVPLQDPGKLKAGDLLMVKILIRGNPARNTLYGTYAGFSTEPNTFAYTTSTDKEGVARIRLLKEGLWLLIARQDFAYPDPTVCDKQSYAASLTFQVR
ncbi:MAG: DUF4198 domain-containing protein [Deltaproteobacteria bacterium]|nr:DUF4198 domain-containing protein [Deltaproteobacteria bacterium]